MQITVGQLIKELSIHHPDCVLYFGGLEFSRLKSRGEKILQLEFEQNVYRDKSGTWVVEDCK